MMVGGPGAVFGGNNGAPGHPSWKFSHSGAWSSRPGISRDLPRSAAPTILISYRVASARYARPCSVCHERGGFVSSH